VLQSPNDSKPLSGMDIEWRAEKASSGGDSQFKDKTKLSVGIFLLGNHLYTFHDNPS
jgi:hypothetical protein